MDDDSDNAWCVKPLTSNLILSANLIAIWTNTQGTQSVTP
jgi:hypothetical protein